MKRQIGNVSTIQQVDNPLSKKEMALMGYTAITLVAAVVLGFAVYMVAQGVKWSLMILSGGVAAQSILVGASTLAFHYLKGRALVIEARGRAEAEVLVARAALARARRGHRE